MKGPLRHALSHPAGRRRRKPVTPVASRGFVGFVADHTEKIAYNHYDSVPSRVGLRVLAWLRTAVQQPQALRERVAALQVVHPASRPTADDIAWLRDYADPFLPPSRIISWLDLLWKTQGNPEAMLGAGVIEDASDYPADGSDCEWGYVIDLDTGVFEVYRGGQTGAHRRGRFAERPHRPGHCQAALVTGWPFDQLPGDREFLAALSNPH